jgi:hypothetical protein
MVIQLINKAWIWPFGQIKDGQSGDLFNKHGDNSMKNSSKIVADCGGEIWRWKQTHSIGK